MHNFIICTKLKQPLILRLDFAQRYRIGIDWDIYGTLFLRCEGKKIATSMKIINPGQWTIAFLETPSGKPQETDQELCLIINHTVIIPLYHISIAPLKPINHTISSNIKPNTLNEIEENPFLSIKQWNLIIIPMLQKLELRIPDVYMAVLWNPSGQVIIEKKHYHWLCKRIRLNRKSSKPVRKHRKND